MGFPNPKPQIPSLYAILDADIAATAGWTLIDLAAACLAGGARLLQIRAKDAPSGRLLETSTAIVEQARLAGALTIVNDRADVARLAGAEGVHVGQDDLSPAAVRGLVGPDAIVGLSTHTSEQIDKALREPISYLAIGPIFATSTKASGYDPVGLTAVKTAATRAREHRIPVVAIGGITLETAADAVAAGAASVAAISDLLSTGDPEQRVRAYLQRLAGVNNV